jgi:hypothetical protein
MHFKTVWGSDALDRSFSIRTFSRLSTLASRASLTSSGTVHERYSEYSIAFTHHPPFSRVLTRVSRVHSVEQNTYGRCFGSFALLFHTVQSGRMFFILYLRQSSVSPFVKRFCVHYFVSSRSNSARIFWCRRTCAYRTVWCL